jgi:hypothetical protein
MAEFVKREYLEETKEVHKWSTLTEVPIFINVPWRLQSGGDLYNVVANEITLQRRLLDLNN